MELRRGLRLHGKRTSSKKTPVAGRGILRQRRERPARGGGTNNISFEGGTEGTPIPTRRRGGKKALPPAQKKKEEKNNQPEGKRRGVRSL